MSNQANSSQYNIIEIFDNFKNYIIFTHLINNEYVILIEIQSNKLIYMFFFFWYWGLISFLFYVGIIPTYIYIYYLINF